MPGARGHAPGDDCKANNTDESHNSTGELDGEPEAAWAYMSIHTALKKGRALGPVVIAFGEMSDDGFFIAVAVPEELATDNRGFYSDKN